MRHDVEAAFNAIKSHAQQMVLGKALKKMTYVDDEGDDCTLAPASIIDALEFCEPRRYPSNGEGGIHTLKVKVEATTEIAKEAPVDKLASFAHDLIALELIAEQYSASPPTRSQCNELEATARKLETQVDSVDASNEEQKHQRKKLVNQLETLFGRIDRLFENLSAVETPAFVPSLRVADEAALWAPAAATVTHSRAGAMIVPREMKEGAVGWCDRGYIYQNVPSEMIGSTLYASNTSLQVVDTLPFLLLQEPMSTSSVKPIEMVVFRRWDGVLLRPVASSGSSRRKRNVGA